MPSEDLQSRCELGQEQLMAMQYLDAEATLAAAESEAWATHDFDTLSRLYMPLQEARRQRRQRCGEGVLRLDLIAQGPDDLLGAGRIIEQYPHGQLLVAGWCSIEPAVRLRELQRQRGLYVETFLAAVYPVGKGRAVVIVPLADQQMPDASTRSIDRLMAILPPQCVVMAAGELPAGDRKGTAETYAMTMAMWERLHLPFLAAADATADPIQRIEAYRRTIRVDYACELAHQKLAAVARELERARRSNEMR